MSQAPPNVLVVALNQLWETQERPRPDGDDDVLGVLVRMMLAQATSKANAAQAFGNLLDQFGGDWERVCAAPVGVLAQSIAVGGLSTQKAPRIQALLTQVYADFGEYSLEALRQRSVDDALSYLLARDGVGPTTARFALMAAAGMDVFPINGGIRRVLTRIGLLDGTESDVEAHARAQAALPVGDAFAAHMTLVTHARITCRTTPRCAQCPVASCPRVGV